jgi:uncharacterized circularly permuted ATP-grasp superfamily protein/uncharacterized alpha-E superfamily protein
MAAGGRGNRLLDAYHPAPGSFDELLDGEGSIRPSWRPVLDALTGLSETERNRLQETAQRMLRENGVTFVAQDDAGTSRPWQLDLFPMLISPAEWQLLEAGLSQRARVLNAVLADIYGPQRALKEGILPPSVVFGNLGFLPACSHIEAKEDIHLHFLAFDVARSPDGRWWVLSDRSEAPSGAGYALENRVVSSRCLPDLFAGQNVRRQASFFRAFNEHFLGLAGRDEPLAVFLTRGPGKLTYFDHAYLARYLGYNIVEGSDLTVRDSRVYLKTVDGLQQVDLILRTVRSEMSDPLELRSDSMIGVPGLLQAARAGSVTIANSLGSGVVESAAFLSFLPGLSRFFLGEEITIPSVATWWCGQEAERNYVVEHLDELLIRRISSTRSLLSKGQDGRIGQYMRTVARERLVELLQRSGHDYVGQEPLPLSTAPVWRDSNSLKPAPVVLRMYVAATSSGYCVMPGGLTRVSVESDPHAAWLSASDVTKDTWVLSDEPVETFSLLAQRQEEGRLKRGHRNLPSRAADHLYWLGRYTERAEAAVRLFRSLVIRLHGETGGHRHLVSHERLVSLLVAQKHMSARRGKRAMQGGRSAVERELWAILFDPESRDGLANVLSNVRRTADVVRERLSFDAFRILTDLTTIPHPSSHARAQETEEALRLLNRLVQYLAALSGMIMENMTRGYGWRFLDMGRRIERVRTMVQLVQHLTVTGNPEQDGALDLLLELADSTMTYRGRYHSAPQLARVLDLLLADDSNPRAASFQVVTLDQHLGVLPHTGNDGMMTADQRIVTRLTGDLKLADMFKISVTTNPSGARFQLTRLTRRVDQAVTDLSDEISRYFFSHSSATRISGSRQAD